MSKIDERDPETKRTDDAERAPTAQPLEGGTEQEETQRLNPAMLAAKAKAADAQVQAKDPNLKETPKAPPVTAPVADDDDANAEPTAAKAKEREESHEEPAKDETAKKDAADTLSLGDRASAWAKRNVDHLIGAGIGLVYVLWLLGTARSLGFSRDEGFYFSASSEYERWFKLLLSTPGKAFERPVIDQIWAANHEHPSLMKSLFALSHHFLWEKWKIFSDQSTAFRFPGMLSMGVALWITYLFGARAFSRRAGIIAAVLLGLMPNVFYHAHLACFDVPIMAMWIACIFTYWCAEKKGGLGWALAAGVMYGLTLETKHNAWMLPAVFLPHALLIHGRAMANETSKTARLPSPRRSSRWRRSGRRCSSSSGPGCGTTRSRESRST